MTHGYGIAYAIPGFLLLVGVEALVARARGRRVYRLRAALSDLGAGVAQQLALVFTWGPLLAGYERILAVVPYHLSPRSAWTWIVAFLAVDLAHYWSHRASHEVSVLWAVHAVHHQSEEYNLAVALRQAVLSAFTVTPFLYPIAILGVPSGVVAAQVTAAAVYQFFLHTQLVGRLGFLERFLSTPSHHRVHHAVNPRYLDRNYGAILIVWDRLFGTFAEERERPVFGTTKPLRSFNPLWAQVHEWIEFGRRSRALRGLDRLAIWWRSPAWTPTGPSPAAAARPRAGAPALPLPRSQKIYAAAQFAPIVSALVAMLVEPALPARVLVPATAPIALALLSLGGLLDARRWAFPLEMARHAGLATWAVAWAPCSWTAVAPVVAGVAAVGSAAWLVLICLPRGARSLRGVVLLAGAALRASRGNGGPKWAR